PRKGRPRGGPGPAGAATLVRPAVRLPVVLPPGQAQGPGGGRRPQAPIRRRGRMSKTAPADWRPLHPAALAEAWSPPAPLRPAGVLSDGATLFENGVYS